MLRGANVFLVTVVGVSILALIMAFTGIYMMGPTCKAQGYDGSYVEKKRQGLLKSFRGVAIRHPDGRLGWQGPPPDFLQLDVLINEMVDLHKQCANSRGDGNCQGAQLSNGGSYSWSRTCDGLDDLGFISILAQGFDFRFSISAPGPHSTNKVQLEIWKK